MSSLPPGSIKLLRYVVPAIAGTILGILLERHVWRGREAL